MTAVVFDLGNVLIEWNPRLLLSDEFIEATDFYTWNAELDRGVAFDDVVANTRAQYAGFDDQFDLFRDNWVGTLGEVLHDVVAVVDALKAKGIPVYALSNSSAETLPRSPVVQELLTKFNGVVISGAVGLIKPDAAIFHHTAELFGLDPSTTWFVDDSLPNVEAAIALGWNAIHFTGPESLEPLAGLEA